MVLREDEGEVIGVEEKICGECAQKNQISLEERISIALSNRKGFSYKCPSCFTVRLVPGNGVQDRDVPLMVNEFFEDEEREMNENEKNTTIKQQAVEQISLF